MMGKQALVIGGTGFLGAAIVRELRGAGWTVSALARGRQPNPFADVPLIAADRSQLGELARATRGQDYDLVVDCAAFQEADALAAIEAFSGRVGQYVFVSTDFVYAASEKAILPIPEDAPKQGDLPYAAGKTACEAALIQAWESRQFPCTVLRPPHILGAGRPLGCDPLAMRDPQLLDRMRAGQALRLLAEGQLLIQPVWNREVGVAIAHLAADERREQSFGQIFNIAGPGGITTRRYYEIIAEFLGVPLRFDSVSLDEFARSSPDKAHMVRHRLYDLGRLAAATGYRPRFAVEDAIHETARWIDGQSRP